LPVGFQIVPRILACDIIAAMVLAQPHTQALSLLPPLVYRRHVDEIGPGDEVVCGLSQTFVMSLERSFFGTVCNSHIYCLKAYYYSEILRIVKVSKFNLMLN